MDVYVAPSIASFMLQFTNQDEQRKYQQKPGKENGSVRKGKLASNKLLSNSGRNYYRIYSVVLYVISMKKG